MANNNSSGLNDNIIKTQSRRSGLSYNEAKEWIARTTGGRGTHVYSDTDIAEVKQKNRQSAANQYNS